MAYQDYITEVMGVVPKISPQYAATLVNRAWSEIRDMRLWSWLFSYGDIYVPPVITTGTCAVTQGSTTVTMNAAAITALASSVLPLPPIPPLASPQLGVGRQFKVPSSASNGVTYNIISYDGVTGIMILDRPYTDVTQSATTFQVLKCYFTPPSTDFIKYISVVNRTTGYSICCDRLVQAQTRLNQMDPQRGGQGDAYVIAAYQPSAIGVPVHEWYPNPVNPTTYNCFYQRRGLDLSATSDLPYTFPSSLLMYRTLSLACTWALANVATYPDLGGTNWVQARMAHDADFKRGLIQAIKQDDEMAAILPIHPGQSGIYPLGGQFAQSHDLSWFFGRM